MDFGSALNSLLFFLFTPCPMQFCLAPLKPASPNVPRSVLCLTYWERSSPGLRDRRQPWAFLLPCPPLPFHLLRAFACWEARSPPFPAFGLSLLLHAPGCDQILLISSLRRFSVPSPSLSLSYHCPGSGPASLLGQNDFLLVAVTPQPYLTQSCLGGLSEKHSLTLHTLW